MREIALIFVMHGADLELRDNYKKTAQDYAIQNQIFEVSDVLSAVSGVPSGNHEGPGSPPPLPSPSGLQTSPLARDQAARGLPVLPQTSLVAGGLASSPADQIPPGKPPPPSPVPLTVQELPGSTQALAEDPALEAFARAQLGESGKESEKNSGSPGEGEEVSPGGTRRKKKNNTVMRHLDMINHSPKPPYGGAKDYKRK